MMKFSRSSRGRLENRLRRLFAPFTALAILGVVGGVGCRRDPVVEVRPSPYVCGLASGSIVIDGRIDEAAWHEASPITTFHAYSPEGAMNLSPTEARILWDSANFYLAISCIDTDIFSCTDEADAESWYGDVGEFFVKPDRNSPVYYEFVISPNGTLYDARYPIRDAESRHHFKAWSSGAQVVSSINGTDGDFSDTDSGYTIEMAIPLSAFHGSTLPADGVTWTFGVCRYDYSKLLDEPLLLMTMRQAPRNGFHCYEEYADLVFRGKGGTH